MWQVHKGSQASCPEIKILLSEVRQIIIFLGSLLISQFLITLDSVDVKYCKHELVRDVVSIHFYYNIGLRCNDITDFIFLDSKRK